jgi:hypothetical protein
MRSAKSGAVANADSATETGSRSQNDARGPEILRELLGEPEFDNVDGEVPNRGGDGRQVDHVFARAPRPSGTLIHLVGFSTTRSMRFSSRSR